MQLIKSKNNNIDAIITNLDLIQVTGQIIRSKTTTLKCNNNLESITGPIKTWMVK